MGFKEVTPYKLVCDNCGRMHPDVFWVEGPLNEDTKLIGEWRSAMFYHSSGSWKLLYVFCKLQCKGKWIGRRKAEKG